MSTSNSSDALESWISDLSGGETSVRRLRKRLAAESTAERLEALETTGECPTCHTSVDHADHLPVQRSA